MEPNWKYFLRFSHLVENLELKNIFCKSWLLACSKDPKTFFETTNTKFSRNFFSIKVSFLTKWIKFALIFSEHSNFSIFWIDYWIRWVKYWSCENCFKTPKFKLLCSLLTMRWEVSQHIFKNHLVLKKYGYYRCWRSIFSFLVKKMQFATAV